MAGERLVVVRAPLADCELAADALWTAGATAIEERALGDVVELVADVPEPALVVTGVPWPSEVVVLDGDAWWDEWRAWAKPVRVGDRLVLTPPWLAAPDVAPGDVVVAIDPGRTFGSGAHPSTRLAVGVLEHLARPGVSLLDVGCGSGILAVTAAMLGAAPVVAIDVDPEAVVATGANAARNDVACSVSTTPISELEGRFDVVVANLLAPILRELADALGERVAPDGCLVLSGYLPEQADEVLAAFGDGWRVGRRPELEGWAAAVLVR